MAEFFFGRPEDMPPQLRQMLGMRTEQEVEQARSAGSKQFRDHCSPVWAEVMDKLGSCKVFASVGGQIAQHAVTCTNVECPIGHGDVVMYCDHALFMKAVKHICEQSEEFDREEAIAIHECWVGRDEESVLRDPRYVAFRSSYDGFVVLIGAWKASTKSPF